MGKHKKKHIRIYAFTRRVSKLKYASFTLTLRQPYAAEIAALRSCGAGALVLVLRHFCNINGRFENKKLARDFPA